MFCVPLYEPQALRQPVRSDLPMWLLTSITILSPTYHGYSLAYPLEPCKLSSSSMHWMSRSSMSDLFFISEDPSDPSPDDLRSNARRYPSGMGGGSAEVPGLPGSTSIGTAAVVVVFSGIADQDASPRGLSSGIQEASVDSTQRVWVAVSGLGYRSTGLAPRCMCPSWCAMAWWLWAWAWAAWA